MDIAPTVVQFIMEVEVEAMEEVAEEDKVIFFNFIFLFFFSKIDFHEFFFLLGYCPSGQSCKSIIQCATLAADGNAQSCQLDGDSFGVCCDNTHANLGNCFLRKSLEGKYHVSYQRTF